MDILESIFLEFHRDRIGEFLQTFNSSICPSNSATVQLCSYSITVIRTEDIIRAQILPLRGSKFDMSLEEMLRIMRYLTSTRCTQDKLFVQGIAKAAPSKLMLWRKEEFPHVHEVNTALQVHWIKQAKKYLLRVVRHGETVDQTLYLNPG